jgi:predicted RNA binding protein YcfA (HicA-like mRNA interferase family)
MCRVLERFGWTRLRISGSHHVYANITTGETIIVPVHGNRDLKNGLQRSIMKVARLTDADL